MIRATTRKTKDGFFQPVLTVIDGNYKKSYTFKDNQYPSIDRKTAQKYADIFRNESLASGCVPSELLPIKNIK